MSFSGMGYLEKEDMPTNLIINTGYKWPFSVEVNLSKNTQFDLHFSIITLFLEVMATLTRLSLLLP